MVEEPTYVEPVVEEHTYEEVVVVDPEPVVEPTPVVEVVEEHIVNDVEEEVVYYDPKPSTLPPTQEPSDYVEAEVEPEVVEPDYLPEPPYIAPPPPTIAEPETSPNWLVDWVDALAETPSPALPKPDVLTADPNPKPAYGISTSYTRKWGKSSYTKPTVKPYTIPSYKPVKYTPKAYTKPTLSYTRPEPKVVEPEPESEESEPEVVEEKREGSRISNVLKDLGVKVKRDSSSVVRTKRRTYSGYDSDNDKYLKTYHNRYSGTKTKPHSHMSCLQRMMAKFSRYNTAVRKRRQ